MLLKHRLKPFLGIALLSKARCCFMLIVFLSATIGLSTRAQVLKLNTINSYLSNEDRDYFNKIAVFEVKFYNTVFETQKNDSCLVVINLFGKQKEYNVVQERAMNTTFIDGFYSPSKNMVFLYKSDRYMNTLIHETSHCILENNFKHSPQWLNEGVATLFGNLVIQNGQVYYSKDLGYINYVKDMIYDGKFNLKSFFNYNPHDFADATKRTYVYALSYDIVFFLVNFDIDYLQRTLVLMQQGYSTMDAFGKVFGGFDKFEKRFADFYKPGVGYNPHIYKYN
jgi:hypothetical protein